VAVDKVVSFTVVLIMNDLFDRDNEVALELVLGTGALASEKESRAVFHARLDLNLAPTIFEIGHASFAKLFTSVRHHFSTAIEKLLKSGLTLNFQISRVSVNTPGHCVLVDVILDFLHQLDLLAVAV